MSLETKTKIICDGCGAFVEGKPSAMSTLCAKSYWDAKKKIQAAGWLVQERAYRRDLHYCRDCADKPQQPIKAPERPKKCDECKRITKAEKADTRARVKMGWQRCGVCGWRRNIWSNATL